MDVYFTFDYELYLGSNTGTVDKCLITPTNKIVAVLNKKSVRATFFVDVLYLMKLKEYSKSYNNLAVDYNKIITQLKELSTKGHSIQLHLHPQWYYSTYNGKEWILDFSHYKLSDCPMSDVHNMFEKGISLLESITTKKVFAFRAGGYSIQSLADYVNIFKQYGILVDSSALTGLKSISRFQVYNFTQVKANRIYR